MRAAIGSLALLSVGGTGAWAQSTPSGFTSAIRYDATRKVVGTIAPDPDGAGGNAHIATRNSYDDKGRLIKVENGVLADWQADDVAPAIWSGFTVHSVTDITYNAVNQKIKETVSGTAGVHRVTQYSYDAVGRLECTALRMEPSTWSSLPASACLQATSSTTDTDDRITRNFYDAAGQLITVRQAVGTNVQIDYARYEYTANGKRKAVIDANGNRAEMTYDGFDRQTRWTFPSKTTVGQVDATDFEAYDYDANGNRTFLTKRDGGKIKYDYDPLNRVEAKTFPLGGGSPVYYTYDLRNLQLSARFGSQSGPGLTQEYDGFGRLKKAATNQSGSIRQLEYAHDPNGNRTSIKHPDGTVFTYDYDGLDRLAWIKQAGSPQIQLGYYSHGAPYFISRANTLNTVQYYNPALQPWILAHDFVGTPNDVNFTFGYNAAGQIVSRQRDNDAFRFTGFPTSDVDRSYARNGLNQYTAAGPVTFCYDKNGNLTSDDANAYKYDAENRLIEVRALATPACVGGVVSYTGVLRKSLSWDPMGRLFQVTDHVPTTPVTRTFLYDGDELIAEYDGANLQRRYVHGAGSDDPLIWYEGSDLSVRRFYHTDHQGSVIAISDAGNVPYAINAYDEYGIPNSNNAGAFQYTGQVWLPELRMYHYKARIYSPTLGRFLQVDPIGYDDQVNLYAYAGNDPINGTDPSGEETCRTNSRGERICTPDPPEEEEVTITGTRERGITGGDVARFLGRVALEVAPGGAAVDCIFISKCSFTDKVLAGADLVPGIGKLAKLAKLRKLRKFGRGCGCVVAGTLVATPTGLVAIETLKVGDMVLAYDPKTDELSPRPVLESIKTQPKPTYNVLLRAATGDSVRFEATDDHPWLNGAKEWRTTEELVVGDRLLARDGQSFEVTEVGLSGKVEVAYTLTVDKLHTYIMGEAGIVVHNVDCLKGMRKLSKGQIKMLKDKGIDPEDLKDGLGMGGREDLYVDSNGDVFVGAKNGIGEATSTGVNVRDF